MKLVDVHFVLEVHAIGETLEEEDAKAAEQVLGRIPEGILLLADKEHVVLAVHVLLVVILHDELAIHELAAIPQPRVLILQIDHLDHHSD